MTGNRRSGPTGRPRVRGWGLPLGFVLVGLFVLLTVRGGAADLSLPVAAEVEKPFVVSVVLPAGLASPALVTYDPKSVQFFGPVVSTPEVQLVAEGRVEINPEGGRPGSFGLRFLPLPGTMMASFAVDLAAERLERKMTLEIPQKQGGYSLIILGIGLLLLLLGWKVWQVQKKHPALMSTRSLFMNYEALEKLRQEYFPGSPDPEKPENNAAPSPQAPATPRPETLPTGTPGLASSPVSAAREARVPTEDRTVPAPAAPTPAEDPDPHEAPTRISGPSTPSGRSTQVGRDVEPSPDEAGTPDMTQKFQVPEPAGETRADPTAPSMPAATEVFAVPSSPPDEPPLSPEKTARRPSGFADIASPASPTATPIDPRKNDQDQKTLPAVSNGTDGRIPPRQGGPVPAGTTSGRGDSGAGTAVPAGGLLVRIQDDRGREFTGKGSQVTIGRKKECAICLTGAEVSRNHAAIRLEGGHPVVVPLSTSNLTGLNGNRLTGPAPIKQGDELSLGGTIFKILEIRLG